jgi:hypothetical protein
VDVCCGVICAEELDSIAYLGSKAADGGVEVEVGTAMVGKGRGM